MIGWLILLVLAASLVAGLVVIARPGRPVLMLILAAVSIAFAGYAWQGRPGLAGKPTRPRDARRTPDSLFADERKLWMETVGGDARVLDAADHLIESGDADYAIGILRGAIVHNPKSSLLWLGLGNALVHYADGRVTPPARYAFERASTLAPGHPAPPYFLGLAYAVSGDLVAADKLWTSVLRNAPVAAPWRDRLLARLFLLRQTEAQSTP